MKPELEGRATRPTTIGEWCGLACQPSVAKRGLRFAVVVGAVLIAINHSDTIIRGDLQASHYLKMGLTVLVPYVVSVLSSVGAMLE